MFQFIFISFLWKLIEKFPFPTKPILSQIQVLMKASIYKFSNNQDYSNCGKKISTLCRVLKIIAKILSAMHMHLPTTGK